MGSKNGSNSSKGRSYYGVMLMVGFFAAVLGVMVLHRMREKRLYNLSLQEKDRALVSLQLILQKERDYYKQARVKIEQLREKAASMRSQKIELNSKLMESQSIIAYLKQQQSTVETTLEQQQSKIRVLSEKESENNELNLSLKELLKQREAEINEMKHQIENLNSDLAKAQDMKKKRLKQREAEIDEMKHQIENLSSDLAKAQDMKKELLKQREAEIDEMKHQIENLSSDLAKAQAMKKESGKGRSEVRESEEASTASKDGDLGNLTISRDVEGLAKANTSVSLTKMQLEKNASSTRSATNGASKTGHLNTTQAKEVGGVVHYQQPESGISEVSRKEGESGDLNGSGEKEEKVLKDEQMENPEVAENKETAFEKPVISHTRTRGQRSNRTRSKGGRRRRTVARGREEEKTEATHDDSLSAMTNESDNGGLIHQETVRERISVDDKEAAEEKGLEQPLEMNESSQEHRKDNMQSDEAAGTESEQGSISDEISTVAKKFNAEEDETVSKDAQLRNLENSMVGDAKNTSTDNETERVEEEHPEQTEHMDSSREGNAVASETETDASDDENVNDRIQDRGADAEREDEDNNEDARAAEIREF